MNDESGQLMESMEEVPFIRLDESEFQKKSFTFTFDTEATR